MWWPSIAIEDELVACGPGPDTHMDTVTDFDHVYVHQGGPNQADCFDFYEQATFPSF